MLRPSIVDMGERNTLVPPNQRSSGDGDLVMEENKSRRQPEKENVAIMTSIILALIG